MKMLIILFSFGLSLNAFAQGACVDLSGTYVYGSMSSQCSMQREIKADRYFEGQDAPLNWPCQLNWVDAPGPDDTFVLKGDSKIVVQQTGCESVKLTMTSVGGKRFSCEITHGQQACMGNDLVVASTEATQACSYKIPSIEKSYHGLFFSKCDRGLCISSLQVQRVAITPWMGYTRQKLIQCGFPSAF